MPLTGITGNQVVNEMIAIRHRTSESSNVYLSPSRAGHSTGFSTAASPEAPGVHVGLRGALTA